MRTLELWSGLMKLLDDHPRLRRTLLAPLARSRSVGGRLPVLARAFLGATALEIHDVDLDRGRIGIGGVDEIMWSSKFLELYHRSIAARTGVEEKNRILYEVGHGGGSFEVDEALARGRWVPAPLLELLEIEDPLALVRRDGEAARFFSRAVAMVMRLIIVEGGWGVPEFDLSKDPIAVTLRNSQEARWAGPSDEPVCYLSAGVMAGYASRILRRRLDAREVACAAAGAPSCVFELR
jgi:predicted hydrocarbon binding protein